MQNAIALQSFVVAVLGFVVAVLSYAIALQSFAIAVLGSAIAVLNLYGNPIVLLSSVTKVEQLGDFRV